MITTRSAAKKLLLDEKYFGTDPRYMLSKNYSEYKHVFKEKEFEQQGSLYTDRNGPLLPLDTFKIIMEYVDIRTLYNLSNSCKTLKGFVSYPLVITAALMSSSSSQKNMYDVHDLLVKNSIYAPSVHRLLRLTVGLKCEFCNSSPVENVNKYYGVYICGECADSNNPEYVKVFTKTGENYWGKRRQIDYILDQDSLITVRKGFRTVRNINSEHPRALRLGIPIQWLNPDLLQVEDLHNILWNQKSSDASNEKIGPLLCHDDFTFLCDLITTVGKEKWSLFLQVYLNHHIGMSPDNEERRNQIINCFDREKERAIINDNKWQWRLQMSSLKYVTMKRVEAINFVEKLKAYIDDPSLSDQVLNYVSSSRFDNAFYKFCDESYVPIEFGYYWMDEIMKHPLNNINKFGKRHFNALAMKIKKAAKKNLDPDTVHPNLRDFVVHSPPTNVL